MSTGTAVSARVLIKPVTPALPGMYFELLGDDTLSGGVGGWESVPRPRRRAATEWVGTPAYTLAMPLLLTGIERALGLDAAIEAQVSTLIQWGLPHAKTGEPPVLQIVGPVRVSASTRWVIDTIEWGEQIRDAHGRRVQQAVTVTLGEYLAPAILKGPAAASRGRRKKKKGGKKGKQKPKIRGEVIR